MASDGSNSANTVVDWAVADHREPERRSAGRGWAGVALAAAAIAATVLLASLFSTETEPAEDEAVAEVVADETPAIVESADETPSVSVTELPQTTLTQAVIPQIQNRTGEFSVAYQSEDGVTILDLDEQLFFSPGEGPVNPASSRILTSPFDGSFAIDTANPATSRLGSGQVIETVFDGVVAHFTSITGAPTVTIFDLENESDSRLITLDDGEDIRMIPGFGPVVLTSEGSLLLGETGATMLTRAEILGGSSTGWLERDCTEDPCALRLVDFETNDEIALLPDSFYVEGSTFIVSPDARSVLRSTPGGAAALYSVSTGGVGWISNDDLTEAVWSDDSSYFVWITDEDPNPAIRMFVASPPRAWLAIDFEDLRVPLPTSGSVLLL